MKVVAAVVKCAKEKAGVPKVSGTAAKVASATGVFKLAAGAEKSMETKMVHAILSKVGCKRRLGLFKKMKKAVKKVGKKVAKAAAPLAKKALKMACKTFGGKCPSACDAGISMIASEAKKHHINNDCAT